ncbi:chemotaxis protein CheA (plasmid) [Methylobacterium sp. NMS12]|uniref:chemotaxis protein CheA n=1 Tax=Methylobacterium sp. NMS12 TaxID=3079766 RepID=UPI003F88057C
MNDLLEQFLVETRELVQSATEDLLALEATPDDAETINRVFRAFHTLKGSVGLFDYPPWFALLHCAEDGLSAARAGKLAPDAALIDLSLETLDATARWADAVEATELLPDTATGEAAALAGRYRALLAAPPSPPGAPETSLPAWAERIVGALPAAADGPALTAVRYVPRSDCFFSGDDPLGLLRKVPGLIALSVEPGAPWPASEEFDAYACNLVLTALSDAPRADIEAVFRLVGDQVTMVGVAPAAPVSKPTGQPESVPHAGHDLDPVVVSILAEQTRVLSAVGGAGTEPGRTEACARAAANVLRSVARAEEADRCRQAYAQGAPALRACIEAILAGPVASDAPVVAAHPGSPAPSEGASGPDAGRTLRVDATRVDALVAGVGELVVARNALRHIVARAEAGEDSNVLARAIREADDTIGRLAAALHRDVVSLRLTPLSQTFRRFARPLREMARDLGKEVVLDMLGEDTEADKGIVEALFEPLLHVVRNAVDHGLEDAETRRRAGKPSAGRVRIAAGPDGDGILVAVADDGRGIDPAFIRRRAAERRLRTAEAIAAMDDDAVTDLIFEPGFSTVDSVGALSGRGVGMDAVRSAAGRMGGSVSVESRIGHGTTIRLHLPRTVALSRVLVVEVGRESYGLGMEAISEVIKCAGSAIHAVGGGAATVLRGRTLPVFSLAELIGHTDAAAGSRPAEALLLVVRTEEGDVALEVDRLADRIDAVVRPPTGLVGTVRNVSGTTTLGDGRVLVLLDPAALVALTGEASQAAQEAERWP